MGCSGCSGCSLFCSLLIATSPFLLEVFRRDRYKKYTHNIDTNILYVNIVFILIFTGDEIIGRTDTYALLGHSEAVALP